MKLIPLTRGLIAKVDDQDYDWLNSLGKWYASTNTRGCHYAARKNNGGTLYMHRLILSPEAGFQVDHIDRDKLNNQRRNLRIITAQQNSLNRPGRGGTSKFKGVCFIRAKNKWRATICKSGKIILLGYFDNEIEAAVVYNEAAKIHHGQFAFLNPI